MNKSIHLINPASDYPSYYGADVIGASTGCPAALVADLTIATVAGMVSQEMQVTLVDENISPVNFTTITGEKHNVRNTSKFI